ncbi:MAG: hypothetical protein ABIJ15_05435 [bacterium]
MLENIMIGVDVASSISIIGAAISFVHAQRTENNKKRVQSIRQQRISEMSRLIGDFSDILNKGDLIVEKVRLAQAGREVDLSADDYTGFCVLVDRYIRINSQLLFNVWASDNEKKLLNNIKTTVYAWNDKFMEALKTHDKRNVPDFVDLLENISKIICQISLSLRKEIELK